MNYNFVLIRTRKGGKYARKILSSVRWINKHKYPRHTFRTVHLTIEEFLEAVIDGRFSAGKNGEFEPWNTIIHARCANPQTDWTIELRKLQGFGFKVVNSVDAIELTSNKLACSLHLQDKVHHPKTWEYKKNFTNQQLLELSNSIDEKLKNPEYIIAKPYTSLEQGANVQKINLFSVGDLDNLRTRFNRVPGNKIVIQEYIPYTALHRVIVIGGKALPYTFIDRVEFHKPGDWKVSCCLNKTTMQICENPFLGLLRLAEHTQKEVGGVINFIDIFEVKNGGNSYFTNAEINTACSLNIHERLAKKAGRKDWNIHYQIAKQLVKELLNV